MSSSPRSPSRRAVLAAMLAASAGPSVRAALPSDPDVVIVGAGAAGIAAARTLMAAGKSVVILEAADRIGGRAFTESARLGLPFDHGCAWLQGPGDLALTELARERGYTLVDHSDPSEAVYVGDRRATVSERRAYWSTYGKIEDALEDADDRDVPAASVIPPGLDWTGTVQSWIGAMDHGVDFADLSTADFNAYEEYDTDYLLAEGLGTLVAEAGQGLPVKLSTPVTGIDWSGDGVAVETAAGTLRARACIVTVSTGVLRSGAIRFAPALPGETAEAVDTLPMGLLTKIALRTDGESFGLSENAWLAYKVPSEMPAEAAFFLTRPFGQPLLVGFVGGAFGWELSRAGADAAIEFATGELVSMLGSDVRKHLTGGLMTDWATNPHTLGAYTAAEPGHFAARARLAAPVGGRIFFAGEAVGGGFMSLCSGAWLSGEATARAVAATIDRHCNSCGPKRGPIGGATE